jgi:hypothetical protein
MGDNPKIQKAPHSRALLRRSMFFSATMMFVATPTQTQRLERHGPVMIGGAVEGI